MPTIYRVYFFNELGKYCNLDVIFERYCATGVPNRWNDSLAKNFNAKFLNTKNFGREGSISFGLLKLNYREYDRIIISSYSSPTEILALIKLKLIRKKYILEVDGGMIKREIFIHKLLKKFLISGASIYFSTSEMTSKYLMYYGAQKNKIVKYNFTSLYKKDILQDPIGIDEKKDLKKKLAIKTDKLILAVGQFIYRKGFDVLLNAYKDLSNDVSICLIGGEVTNEYKNIVKTNYMKNVIFIDNISKEKLVQYYLAADLFVLPTREDIWGLVINEAMAIGLPIITTDKCIAGIELVKDFENGFIVPADSESELLKLTNLLLNDEYLRRRISLNNLIKIRNYTFEKMVEQHLQIFSREGDIDE